ncbi:hypothetical protein Q1695_008690 [Nippostrongylus brasiliensis]|nr:hypothetical protein Q1695_008690 [Nippostrongylus brasiliensis]
MTVDEAMDLLQRHLKENPNMSAQRIIRPPAAPPKKATAGQAQSKRDGRATLNAVDDEDCNFSHLDSVIKTEDEVTALLLSIVIGTLLFLGLCIIVAKRVQT